MKTIQVSNWLKQQMTQHTSKVGSVTTKVQEKINHLTKEIPYLRHQSSVKLHFKKIEKMLNCISYQMLVEYSQVWASVDPSPAQGGVGGYQWPVE